MAVQWPHAGPMATAWLICRPLAMAGGGNWVPRLEDRVDSGCGRLSLATGAALADRRATVCRPPGLGRWWHRSC